MKKSLRIAHQDGLKRQKSEGDGERKKRKKKSLPGKLMNQTNDMFLKKSDKINFSKINFLTLKQGKNSRFLKNYGISVQFLQYIPIFFKKIFLTFQKKRVY